MVLAWSCPAAAQDEAAASDGSVRFLVAENFWADWDPYNHSAQIQRRLEAQIFDYLVDFPDTKGDPVPMLATEWTPIDDMTWEFTLRDGVTFQDGSAFDAADVKTSIELASGTSCGRVPTAPKYPACRPVNGFPRPSRSSMTRPSGSSAKHPSRASSRSSAPRPSSAPTTSGTT